MEGMTGGIGGVGTGLQPEADEEEDPDGSRTHLERPTDVLVLGMDAWMVEGIVMRRGVKEKGWRDRGDRVKGYSERAKIRAKIPTTSLRKARRTVGPPPGALALSLNTPR